MMNGLGVYEWPDGKKYEGAYENDMKHGFGKFTFSDGKIY